MAYLDFFIVSLIPVLKTLLITAVGLFLALDRVNILDLSARRNLNNLVFYVFSPAYVGSSLADTITMSSLIELWFIPVNVVLTFVIGSILGWMLYKITRAPRHLRGLLICCCATGNIGSLPMIILPAICNETNSPFGDSSTCSTNGQAYASLSTADNAETQDLLLLTNSMEDDSKTPFLKKLQKQLEIWESKLNLKKIFSPSTIATIVALIIGTVTPLRHLIVGENAPLRVIDSSVSLLGDAAVPAMTMILGANLREGFQKSEVGPWIIAGVQAVRFIAMPLLGTIIVRGAHYIGLVGSDSLYQFLLLLQHSVPCAMALGTMTQLFGMGESDCAVILLWNYGVASLAVTLWSTYYMSIVIP